MRRSVATTVLFAVPALAAGGLFLAACEDGPAQTFSPATGILFNNGQVDASYDPVEAGLDGNYNGRTVLQICTAELLRARWAKMLTEPMAPPTTFAGLDLRGGPEWPGLTVEQSEQAPDPNTLEGGNCQGTAGGAGGCGENQSDICGNVTWGDNGEVNFSYDQGTHIIDQLDLSVGYTGTMVFNSPPASANNCAGAPYAAAAHKYTIQLGFPTLKDNHNFLMDWGKGSQYGWDPATSQLDTCATSAGKVFGVASGGCGVAELYDAITYTFDMAAGVVWPGCSGVAKAKGDQNFGGCQGDGTCLYEANDGAGNAYFGIRPLAQYMIFFSTIPQPAASEPYYMYIDYAKFVPNSTLNMDLALNNTGPNTDAVPLGVTSGTKCRQAIGQPWSGTGSYLNDCIMPFDPPGNMSNAENQINYNKLVGGHTHNLEEITFNVVGVNQDFALSSGNVTGKPVPGGSNLGLYGVVTDTMLPQAGDLATEWYFDVRAFGNPANECVKGICPPSAGGAIDYHGSGLITREYQRLVENDLASLVGKLPSVPGSCEFGPGSPGNVTYPVPVDNKHVCTGMEVMTNAGFATYPSDGKNVNSPGGLRTDALFGLGHNAAVLKPGDHLISFIPNFDFAGYDYGYFWDESLDWTVRVLGKGDIHSIPVAAQDRRYYFRWFGVAVVKYMRAYGKYGAATQPPQVAAEPIDMESLFFDNQYGAQFDSFEYIDLATIDGFGPNAKTAPDPNKPYTGVPFDFEYGTDVKSANQRYTNWYKRLDREEVALYVALAAHNEKSNGYTAANANRGINLTNMYGSTILSSVGLPYECAAVPFDCSTGTCKYSNTKDWPAAAKDCAGLNPDGWLVDPATGKGLQDLNGQMQALEKASGSPAAVQNAYQAVYDGAAHNILWQYPAALGSYSVASGAAGASPGRTIFSQGHSPITVCPVGATNCRDPNQTTSKTSVAIGAAQATLPNFKNPWAACFQQVPGVKNAKGCDPTDTNYVDSEIYTYIPWTPSQPGIGFEIPSNGSSNLWVQTSQLDFTGNLETYVVDYVPYADPGMTASCNYGAACATGYTCDTASGACIASDNSIEIRAIEAHDFLGEVFPCKDGMTGDVLHVRMYTSTYDILTWLAAHPGEPSNPNFGYGLAQTQCGIIVRYSPYDNYPDFVTSLANGVTMNTNQGQGFGRIVDATLFNPLYETINQ